ncbi:MAG: SCP-like extracellular, partial [Sphingobacterium sp.]|nr:SCP-like extracellular [Sphingobacterium sp.]
AAGISYSAVGENIAENTSVQAAETSFMNSSGHRANILNSNYTTVGIGVAYDSAGNVYVVQDFIK